MRSLSEPWQSFGFVVIGSKANSKLPLNSKLPVHAHSDTATMHGVPAKNLDDGGCVTCAPALHFRNLGVVIPAATDYNSFRF